MSTTGTIHKDSFIQGHYDPAIKKLMQTVRLAKDSGASPELIQSIEESLALCRRRDKFMEDLTTQESETCAKIKSETVSYDWQKVHDEKKTTWKLGAGMMSGHVEGQFLKSFLSAQKAKRVLDVGMFTGYSALSIAEALPADGQIVSLDLDDFLKQLVQTSTQSSPHKDKIHIVIGPAIDSMTRMNEERQSFDAVFLDANKAEYEDYLKLCLEPTGHLLAPGGTVIVDNAFMHGSAYSDPNSSTAKFGQFLRTRPDLHMVLVPMRDGLYLIRRRADVDGGVV